mmetsp:Transcript_907/g.3180  ORF Transcript_907/g.3180 Transcript_907/m.3180 type:complete len:336 (+) Transcript_907:165-1172(+)
MVPVIMVSAIVMSAVMVGTIMMPVILVSTVMVVTAVVTTHLPQSRPEVLPIIAEVQVLLCLARLALVEGRLVLPMPRHELLVLAEGLASILQRREYPLARPGVEEVSDVAVLEAARVGPHPYLEGGGLADEGPLIRTVRGEDRHAVHRAVLQRLRAHALEQVDHGVVARDVDVEALAEQLPVERLCENLVREPGIGGGEGEGRLQQPGGSASAEERLGHGVHAVRLGPTPVAVRVEAPADLLEGLQEPAHLEVRPLHLEGQHARHVAAADLADLPPDQAASGPCVGLLHRDAVFQAAGLEDEPGRKVLRLVRLRAVVVVHGVRVVRKQERQEHDA